VVPKSDNSKEIKSFLLRQVVIYNMPMLILFVEDDKKVGTLELLLTPDGHVIFHKNNN